jgi:hypothetical protein
VSDAQPLRLVLKPSTVLAAAVVAVHAAAGLCALAVLPGWPGQLLAATFLLLGLAAAHDRALLRGARAPRALEIGRDGSAMLLLASGERAMAAPLAGIGVTRYWVALRLSGLPGRRSLLVPADMLASEPGRLLRLWALWGRLPGVAPRQLAA